MKFERLKQLLLESKDNFKKWFGDSKVVDKNNNPLIVYHGTKDNFSTFKIPAWFTPNKKFADLFSSEWSQDSTRSKSSKIISVYLKIENPYYTDDWSVTEPMDMKIFNKIKENGHDGVIFQNGDEVEYIVFHPSQIKSVENNGEFNSNSENIYEQLYQPDLFDDPPVKPKLIFLGIDKTNYGLYRINFGYGNEDISF